MQASLVEARLAQVSEQAAARWEKQKQILPQKQRPTTTHKQAVQEESGRENKGIYRIVFEGYGSAIVKTMENMIHT